MQRQFDRRYGGRFRVRLRRIDDPFVRTFSRFCRGCRLGWYGTRVTPHNPRGVLLWQTHSQQPQQSQQQSRRYQIVRRRGAVRVSDQQYYFSIRFGRPHRFDRSPHQWRRTVRIHLKNISQPSPAQLSQSAPVSHSVSQSAQPFQQPRLLRVLYRPSCHDGGGPKWMPGGAEENPFAMDGGLRQRNEIGLLPPSISFV